MATHLSLITPSGRALCINEPNQNKLAVSHPFYCSLMIDLLMLWCLFSFTCYLYFLSLFWHFIDPFLFRSLFLALSNKCRAQSCFSSEFTEIGARINQSPNTLHETTVTTRVYVHERWAFSKLFRKLVLKSNIDWRTKCHFTILTIWNSYRIPCLELEFCVDLQIYATTEKFYSKCFCWDIFMLCIEYLFVWQLVLYMYYDVEYNYPIKRWQKILESTLKG